jgi:hypothetical protein
MPASVSNVFEPFACVSWLNVNPPVDSNNDAKTAGSVIGAPENSAALSVSAWAAAASPCVRAVMSRASARWAARSSGLAAVPASSPSIASRSSSVNQRRYVPTSRSSVFSQYW